MIARDAFDHYPTPTALIEADVVRYLRGNQWLVQNGYLPRYHAVLCDPPYGLAFMGKHWDTLGTHEFQAWVTEWGTLMLDYVYPGALLVAFGGTRTYHRLAAGLEDAGWEIADCIMWAYGSGFPKSAAIDKMLDKEAGATREVVGADSRPRYDSAYAKWDKPYEKRSKNFGQGEWDVTVPATPLAARWQGYGTALKPAYEIVVTAKAPVHPITERGIIVANLNRLGMQLWLLLHASTADGSSTFNQSEFDAALSTARWSADALTSTRDVLCAQMDTSRFVSAVTSSLNTVSLWLDTLDAISNTGNTSTIATALDTTTDWKTLNSCLLAITPESIIRDTIYPLGWLSSASPAESYFHAVRTSMNAIQTLFAAESATSGAREILAEKADRETQNAPGNLPAVIARAPRGKRTYAALAREFGTGALAIDAARIPSPIAEDFARPVNHTGIHEGWDRPWKHDPEALARERIKRDEMEVKAATLGRWPANFALVCTCDSDDHDPTCPVAVLGAQSGETGNGYRANSSTQSGSAFHNNGGAGERGHNDTGTAARFFYQAKAAAWEREAGLSDRARRNVNDGRNTPIDNLFQRGETQRLNVHPTVKPIRMTEYLARLLLPPELDEPRRLLVPFAGSGSEMIGALLAGWDVVTGIEREAEYAELARARVGWWAQFGTYEDARKADARARRDRPARPLVLKGEIWDKKQDEEWEAAWREYGKRPPAPIDDKPAQLALFEEVGA